MKRTFILGVGAQKAGTTWLSDYIRLDSNFRLGLIKEKELHIWDRKDLPQFSPPRRRIFRSKGKKQLLMACMEQFEPLYFQYFSSLLRNGGITADITPSYAGLRAERFLSIRRQFEKVNVEVKVVFLMRDPVSRCVSAFNMDMHKASLLQNDHCAITATDYDSKFLSYIQTEGCQLRTEYCSTLRALRRSFDSENIGVFFFEELFSEERLCQLSSFLGVSFFPEQASIKSNAAKKKIPLSPTSLSICARQYEAVYEEVKKEFPTQHKLWRGYEHL